MARITLTATVVKNQGFYVRVEASNGMTYYGLRDQVRKNCHKMIYGTWRTDSREIDRELPFNHMPKCVRQLIAGHFAQLAA